MSPALLRTAVAAYMQINRGTMNNSNEKRPAVHGLFNELIDTTVQKYLLWPFTIQHISPESYSYSNESS